MEFDAQRNAVFLGWIFCEGENESTRDLGCGQSQIVVQFLNFSGLIFGRSMKSENRRRVATGAKRRGAEQLRVGAATRTLIENFHSKERRQDF